MSKLHDYGIPDDAPDSRRKSPTHVIVIDDDPVDRTSWRDILTPSGFQHITVVNNPADFKAALSTGAASCLVIIGSAIHHDESEYIASASNSGCHHVLLRTASQDSDQISTLLRQGATGVIFADGARSSPAVALATLALLTAREIEVIRMVADGRSNKWIGESLQLSALTVKSHLARVGRKLGTGDRAHTVAVALRAGVIS